MVVKYTVMVVVVVQMAEEQLLDLLLAVQNERK